MILKAAGIKSHENCWNYWKVFLKKGTKINKVEDERIKGALLTKAYIARDTMNSQLVEG